MIETVTDGELEARACDISNTMETKPSDGGFAYKARCHLIDFVRHRKNLSEGPDDKSEPYLASERTQKRE